VDQVRQEGDAAVKQFTEKFDKVKLDDVCVAAQVGPKLHSSCQVCGNLQLLPVKVALLCGAAGLLSQAVSVAGNCQSLFHICLTCLCGTGRWLLSCLVAGAIEAAVSPGTTQHRITL